MRIAKHDSWVEAHSRRNHFEIVIGKATSRYGLFGGVMVYESHNWWHMSIGVTLFKWYITIMFRWRVFGCQYNRRDQEDYYVGE